MVMRYPFVLRAAAKETSKRIREKPAKQARRNRSKAEGFTREDSPLSFLKHALKLSSF
jgi:hypothetical protein